MNKILLSVAMVLIISAGNLFSQSFSNGTSVLNSAPGSNNQPCVFDMNSDGLDDVVRISDNTVYIDFQQTDGTFDQESYTVSMQNYASWSISGGDIDGNGFNDLAIGGGQRASLLMADDDGNGFSEVFFEDYIFCQRNNVVDIDNDGNLDAFFCHDTDESHPFRNDGAGNMSEDQSLIQTLPLGGNYASIWTDFDHDNDLDLYITKCRQGTSPGDPQRMNGLYVNNGDGTFSESAAEYGLDDDDQSWVTIFEDFDNDGDFDAYTVNHYEANILYSNDGTGHMTHVIDGSGINENDLGSWACIGGDFDNDGYVDILSESATNDEFYLNNGDFTFTASSLNFDDGALGDLNNDGFIDVFTGNTLWLNDANDNNWIKFNLQGIISNSNAIGAKVMIYGDFGQQIREVRSGQSFNPMSTFTQFFGLGSHTSVDYVEVIWPSGMVTTVDGPEVNSTVTLIEAECLFETEDITASGDVQLCPGESVDLVAPSGYTYSWNQDLGSGQTVSVSESGVYNVIMTQLDSDCISISNSIVISMVDQTPPSIDFGLSNVSCASNPITLTASEGMSYLWNTTENTQSITVNQTGDYSVSVTNQCGVLTSENISLEFILVENPVVTSDTEIEEEGLLTIEAEGENIVWYDDVDLSEVLGTGNSIELDVADGQTIYLQSSVGSIGANQEGGKPDFSGGGGLPSSGGGSTFDVWEEFTLLSVRVNAPSEGERTIQLVDGDENVLESYTGNMVGEMTIELDWYIPVGEEYQILCSENNLFRNNSGVNYPYPIGDVGELYTSTFGTQYYYYFYNWQIQKTSTICYSDVVEVDFTITGIDELSQITNLEIFPNPVSDVLNIQLDLKESLDMELELLNVVGQSVLTKTLGTLKAGSHLRQMEVKGIASGTYQLLLKSEKGQQTVSIVIE